MIFRPPHHRDIGELAARMRAADVAEMHALGRTDMTQVLVECIRASDWSLAGLRGSTLLGIFGVAPLHPGQLLCDTGVPWMLGTDALFAERRPLMALPPAYIRSMLEQYPKLVNHVHADNARSIAWLQRLGFRMHDPAPFGPLGAPFRRFEMTRHV